MGAAAATVVMAAGVVFAQTLAPEIPRWISPAPATPPPQPSQISPQSDSDAVIAALAAARSRDGQRIRLAMAQIGAPLPRKLALWLLADTAPDSMSFFEADMARRELAGWPRDEERQIAAERQVETSGMAPAALIAWFAGQEPATARGALVLATALRSTGDEPAADALIRHFWRTNVFDEDTQELILSRFAVALTQADHVARADLLLYGGQGDAARDMIRLLPPDQQAIAQARMALRRGASDAQMLVDSLPYAAQTSPGLVYERILSLRERGQDDQALALMSYLPAKLPLESAAERLWRYGALVVAALKAGDTSAAYAAAAHSGLTSGANAAEAQFFAGWIALTRLKDAKLADSHFAALQTIGQSPLTQSRALYWRGRAALAMGDPLGAQLFFGQAARYYTTFYGQLSAANTGLTTITLGRDPQITAADRATFEAREPVRAARLLAQAGAKDTFKSFVADLSETLPTTADEAQLVDLARGYGDQELSMRVVRNAAKRDLILPERGYPIRTPPAAFGAPEGSFVLGITRQESGFDPRARSGAGARGMMQLMPGTAQVIARRLGVAYATDELKDPDYNMQLGSAFLGQLVGQFGGSYVMATAAYNAGPSRPSEWSLLCGDPRSASTDPVNFIECIPFSETRDYVMRVLEATQVYRARLNGGAAPLTLAADLKRGAYGYTPMSPIMAVSQGGVSAALP
ncbi:MAG TPA: lytic transglycosylase domain-containing protein [Caulobacteraceae bacterium]